MQALPHYSLHNCSALHTQSVYLLFFHLLHSHSSCDQYCHSESPHILQLCMTDDSTFITHSYRVTALGQPTAKHFVCGGLNEMFPVKFQAFEYLVPTGNWLFCFCFVFLRPRRYLLAEESLVAGSELTKAGSHFQRTLFASYLQQISAAAPPTSPLLALLSCQELTTSGTMRQINCFFSKLPWSYCFTTATEM